MKDCNYQIAINNNIIEYRRKYKLVANKKTIIAYLDSQNILPSKYDSIVKNYPDDVIRKFEMTGLIITHDGLKHIYYNFSQFNKARVDAILEKFKNYKFETLANQNDYYNYLYDIELPWLENDETRKKFYQKHDLLGRILTLIKEHLNKPKKLLRISLIIQLSVKSQTLWKKKLY